MSDYLLGITGSLDNLGDVDEQKSLASAAYSDALAKYDTAVQKQGLVDTVIETTTPAIIAALAPTAIKFLASTYRSTFGLPEAGAPVAGPAAGAPVAGPAVPAGPAVDAAPVVGDGAGVVPSGLPTGTFGDVADEIAEFSQPLGELGGLVGAPVAGIVAAPIAEGAGIMATVGSTITEVGAGVVSLGAQLATSTAGALASVPGAVSTGMNVATNIAATTGDVGEAVSGGIEAASAGLDLTGIGAAVGLVLGAGALIYSLVETFMPHHAPKMPAVEEVAGLEAQPQARL
jgi:hypothetical protein